MQAGLYLHIPFCTRRCSYCDFYTVAGRADAIDPYLHALETELRLYAARPSIHNLTFSTLFFGGGTPSLLTADQFATLLSRITVLLRVTERPEVTVETNPGTVTLQKLQGFRDAGINRLSIGVQSFHEEELRFLERNHDGHEAVRCFELARKAGFENINLDLIFGLPGQSLPSWKKSLLKAVALQPEHISAYNLTFEAGTPLTRRLQKGQFKAPAETPLRSMQLQTMEVLQKHGFLQYEISNYAKPGFVCRHNQKYWDGSPYLGLGVSAHSYLRRRRFWNVRHLQKYMHSLSHGRFAVEGEENLPKETLAFERIYLGLRQMSGLSLMAFQQRLGVSFVEKYADTLGKLFAADFGDRTLADAVTRGKINLRGKFLEIDAGVLRLTTEGVLVADAICAEFA